MKGNSGIFECVVNSVFKICTGVFGLGSPDGSGEVFILYLQGHVVRP